MSNFWNSLFNGPIQNGPLDIDGDDRTTPVSRTTASLTGRAARLRKAIGGTAKPKLVDEVNDLGKTMGHSFASDGLPNMLSELEEVVLGIRSDSSAAASDSASTIVDGIKKMREDIGLPNNSGQPTEASLKELEKSIFGTSKEGPFLNRVLALKKEIYGSL